MIPPSAEEIEKDLAEEKEKEEKGSPSKSKKPKKAFSPPEHLFKYELEEVEPDEGEVSQVCYTSYTNFFCHEKCDQMLKWKVAQIFPKVAQKYPQLDLLD